MRGRRKTNLGAVVVLLAVVALGVGAFWYFDRDSIDHAAVGDCVSLDDNDSDSPFQVVDCANPAARYRVLAVLPDSAQKCLDVPGASQSSTSDNGMVCMGDKDVDPATAINGAKVGDCVRIDGDDAEKLACSSAQAQDKVLKRLTNVLNVNLDQACQNVAGTTKYYPWTWKSIGATVTEPDVSVDVLLCLGPK